MAKIIYSNQNAVRNDPLDQRLTGVLDAAAQAAGIDQIVVISGGQEAAGQGGSRTGSTRHDHGGAADIELFVGGRRLDFTNPQDQAIFQRFVSEAAANGATGIGAGVDYMGPNRIHVGFGTPAIWGAGGSSANAPEWLRTAYTPRGFGNPGAGAGEVQGDRTERMNRAEPQVAGMRSLPVLEAIRTKRQERGLKTPLLDGLISRLGKQGSFEDRANEALQVAQDALNFDPAQNRPQTAAVPTQAPEAAQVVPTALRSPFEEMDRERRAGPRGLDPRQQADWRWADQTIEALRATPETPPPPPPLDRQREDVARLMGPTMNGSMLPGGFQSLPPSMGFSPTTPPWVQAPNYQVNPASLPPPIIRALMN